MTFFEKILLNRLMRTPENRRGFTLIELLVVVSIISLLSSVMYASIAEARGKARDSARIQQVRQIDTAVALYTSTNGKAPDLAGTCGPNSTLGVAGCTARSTAANNSDEKLAWDKFLTEIAPFIPLAEVAANADPCGPSGCPVSGGTTGYVYVAPGGMMELCPNGSCGYTGSFDDAYQLYAVLERTVTPYGSSSFGTIATVLPPSPGSVTITQPSSGSTITHGGLVTVGWNVSGIPSPASIIVTAVDVNDMIIFSSGPISGSATSYSQSYPNYDGHATIIVRVNKTDGSFVSSSVPVIFALNPPPPPPPSPIIELFGGFVSGEPSFDASFSWSTQFTTTCSMTIENGSHYSGPTSVATGGSYNSVIYDWNDPFIFTLACVGPSGSASKFIEI